MAEGGRQRSTSWRGDLARSKMTVRDITSDRAQVVIDVQRPYGARVVIEVANEDGEWLVDDSSAVPVGD